MKVLLVNGSPRANSNTLLGLHEMQTLRVLARNMSFLIKSIALGKEKFGLPEKEEHAWTNFI